MEDNITNNDAQTAGGTIAPQKQSRKFNISRLPAIPVVGGFIVLIIVIVLGLFIFKYLSGPSKVDTLSSQAQGDMVKGNYEDAQNKLSQALEIDKEDPILLSQMINAISLEGNQGGSESAAFDQSKPFIKKALTSSPDDAFVLMAVGYAYESKGEYKKAEEYYKKAVEIDPKSAEAWFHLGHVSQFLGKKTDAIQAYDKAFALDPNNPQVLMARGNAFLSERKAQESYESFKKAAEQPNISAQSKAEALTAASVIRATQDDYVHIVEAVKLSEQAVATSPNFSPALAAHGYNLYLSGMQRTGFDYIVKSTEANPRISKNYFILSMIYRTAQDYKYAIEAGKEAVERVDNDNTIFSPEDRKSQKADYTYELGKTYSSSGSDTDALSYLREAALLKPSLANVIRSDFENRGVFKNLSNNQEFQNLISI